MLRYAFIIFIFLAFFSCRDEKDASNIFATQNFMRLTLPDDSLKNMFVIYKSTVDTGLTMYKFYWDNGKLQGISYFRGNMKTGPWIRFFDDGKISFQGSFQNGKKVGQHRVYFPNGKLSSQEQYNNDLKSGPGYYYNPDGSVKEDTAK